MDIKTIRKNTNLSQRGFSNHFGIPLGTLRNWEQGIAKPPEYVYNMIFASLGRDVMINVETIKFIKMLDKLAELSDAGIYDFYEPAPGTENQGISFDSHAPDNNGHFPVVLDACINDDPACYHHDIISYYDSDSEEFSVRAVIDDEDDPYIHVKLFLSKQDIVIEGGRWYFA